MAESDYLSEGSVYTTFSKGPKSVYRWQDEVNLPSAIFNVPQQDEDDEWGRTQRIAEERMLDYVAKIYYTLFDNQGSICGIVLEPGEAGADINVAKNMIRLIGRASTSDTGVFDLSTPSLTLGNVIVDGSANTINIGTDTQLSASSFTIDSNTTFSSGLSNSTFQYKDKNVIRFTNNGTDAAYTEIIINGKSYRFDENGLTLPSGSTISGTINSSNIVPVSDNAYNIGTAALRFATIYGVNANFTGNGTFSGSITASSINSSSFGNQSSATYICGTSVSIIYAGGYTLNFENNSLIPALDGNSDLGSSLKRFGYVYARRVDIASQLTTGTVLPITDLSYDIGDPSYRFNYFYANTGFFSNRIEAPQLCSNGGLGLYSSVVDIYAGSSIRASFTATTLNVYTDIRPNSDSVRDLGTASLRWDNIYSKKIYATGFVGAEFGDGTKDVALCGYSVQLYDGPSDKRIYFRNSQFVPTTNNYISLGVASLKWSSVYATTMYATEFKGSEFGDGAMDVALCGFSVQLYDGVSNTRLYFRNTQFVPTTNDHIDLGTTALRWNNVHASRIYVNATLNPSNTGQVALGSSATTFKELWLIDGATSNPVRVYVCNGILKT